MQAGFHGETDSLARLREDVWREIVIECSYALGVKAGDFHGESPSGRVGKSQFGTVGWRESACALASEVIWSVMVEKHTTVFNVEARATAQRLRWAGRGVPVDAGDAGLR